MTSELLVSQVNRLQETVNRFQTRFSCLLILEDLIQALIDHYGTTAGPSTTIPLSARFYAYDSHGDIWGAIPDEATHAICSLWLGQLKVNNELVIRGVRFMVRVHPDRVLDGKPLLLLIPQNRLQSTSVENLYVKERLQARTHSHLLKNHPKLPGCIINAKRVSTWTKDGNLLGTNGTKDISTWSGHAPLETLAALWLQRQPRTPPSATLTADSVLIREFVLCVAKHPTAGCHFTLSGQKTLAAYLVLIESGGARHELSRIAIGTVPFPSR